MLLLSSRYYLLSTESIDDRCMVKLECATWKVLAPSKFLNLSGCTTHIKSKEYQFPTKKWLSKMYITFSWTIRFWRTANWKNVSVLQSFWPSLISQEHCETRLPNKKWPLWNKPLKRLFGRVDLEIQESLEENWRSCLWSGVPSTWEQKKHSRLKPCLGTHPWGSSSPPVRSRLLQASRPINFHSSLPAFTSSLASLSRRTDL